MPRTLSFLTAGLAALTVAGMLAAPAEAGTAHSFVVSEKPVAWTPHILDGSVKSIVQIGRTVVVGGDFSTVTDPNRDVTVERDGLFAFDYGTGRIDTDFTPRVNGTVVSLAAGPGATVYAGGTFTRVNGYAQRGVTQLSTANGSRMTAFGGNLDNGATYRLATHSGKLYVGGSFTSISGQSRTGIARLDGTSGAVDGAFDIAISEPRRGTLRVQELALSPDGRRLLINGTFTKVQGQRRQQIAMIDTASSPARLGNWSTEAFASECDYAKLHTYMRQMSFSPDGSYFAVVTSGGPEKKPGLCKSASRWETTDIPQSRHTWVNYTGGDSLYSVEVTGAAVYVGGHQRWLDNPRGHKSAGEGAVSREGIGAIDPRTGKALAWNPGRTRGYGVEALLSTPDGLYVGSDTERLNGLYRARLGMFPAL
ncbi:hypothetical protein Nans01_35740 [Nocardiopsis ansamitocini]|uniref:PKD domain containing protein n=1 Tax=Nocardiopsis ansamitocini TaxID=1670832 RepID=A0A9W6P928_9ACTN|nr:hypothetical protein Nans01_35740 [Nocardiopsis ansamitocini]